MKAETVPTIITILLGILAVVVSFLSYYFYIKGKLYKAAEGAINDAEPDEDPEDEKISAQKLDAATDQVYALIPAILKPIIKRDVVKGIVQAAFDRIEAYAKKQVSKNSKK